MKLFSAFTSVLSGVGRGTSNGTPRAVREKIRSVLGVRELEAMPPQAVRAFQLASDPRAGSGDFVKVIESDQALCARVIRVANSVYYYRGKKAEDIDSAVANIGLDELRSYLSTTVLRSLMPGRNDMMRESGWAHSVMVALIARTLASHAQNVTTGGAFLAGLLHDVGKLLMMRRASLLYDRVLSRINSGGISALAAEEEIYGVHHVEVGRWIAEEWQFPPHTVQAISDHHLSWDELPPLSYPSIVKAADIISYALPFCPQRSQQPLKEMAKSELEGVWKHLNISSDQGRTLMETLNEALPEEYGFYKTLIES